MHPLRFPNSGIRAKVFVRKIGFKLHVMRLNRVESFNAFAARQRGGRDGRGWLQKAAGCDQGPLTRGRLATGNPPCRGNRLQLRPPCKGAADHRQGGGCPQGQQPARGDHPWARSAAASPQRRLAAARP
ncbi:hypothetical protein B296_00049560 [Ensete ventricosum]|uniref:Uncharacterized protein n=1 Tax=Ensete ventricosum TaxID=4639 RepID=A0A426XG38_ENSVE|nr:hypothetical protein B296_00049560 [Ensete ventricosum]